MESPKNQRHGVLFHVLDVAFNIIVIVAIVAAIRTFLVSPFQVEGHSMDDTLQDKQYIVINKLAYLVGKPQRGDVVVFHPPTADGQKRGKYYVKRVIGLPGDEVIIREGYVYLKIPGSDAETKVDESSYLSDVSFGHTFRNPPSSGDTTAQSFTVPEGKYFVLGDNRTGSYDSRSFASDPASNASPYVPEAEIKGRVWFIALPVTKIHALEPPSYDL